MKFNSPEESNFTHNKGEYSIHAYLEALCEVISSENSVQNKVTIEEEMHD